MFASNCAQPRLPLLCVACRSQLLKAARLLPRHITSLSERMGYMRKLLGLESLGAPERLELVARLLLDVRDELLSRAVVNLSVPPSRATIAACYRPGGAASGGASYPWHLWEVMLFSVQEEGGRRGGAAQLPVDVRRQAANSNLWTEWSEVMRLFIMTAAQVGEAGEGCWRVYAWACPFGS
jgi:hypothetical protein